MNKIAICIYGIPLNCKCIEFVRLMSQKYRTALFLHFWDYEKYVFDKKLFKIQNVELHICSNLYHDFHDVLIRKRNLFKNDKDGYLPDTGYIALLCSMNKVDKLRKSIESKNVHPYTCVFSMTYNTQIDKIIDLNQFDLNQLNMPYTCESPINPNFVFGNSKRMTEFCDLYNKIENFNKEKSQDVWIENHIKDMKVNRFWLN